MTSEVTSGVLVHMRHIRAAGFCWRNGAKPWFDSHGIDYRRLKAGIPVEEIEAARDIMALEVGRIAREEHGR